MEKQIKKINCKIEPQGYLSLSSQKTAHIKEEILREVQTVKIPFITNVKIALLFNPEATPQEILESLDVLRKNLVLRLYIQNNPKKVTHET